MIHVLQGGNRWSAIEYEMGEAEEALEGWICRMRFMFTVGKAHALHWLERSQAG